MPDNYEFKKDKRFEDYEESLEANRYIHDAYLKAINHPIRREILKLILENKEGLSEDQLFGQLKEYEVLNQRETLRYNLDYLLKAFCIKTIEKDNHIYYQITKSGKIVEYLKKF